MADVYFNPDRMFLASAMTTGFPWDDLRRGIGNYYDDAKPTTFLAMFETADGCIKFTELPNAESMVRCALSKSVRMGEKEEGLALTNVSRTYQLWDRSGPGGRLLHYREVV